MVSNSYVVQHGVETSSFDIQDKLRINYVNNYKLNLQITVL